MALTGRAALAALIGALIALAFRAVPALIVVNALILAGIVGDLILAAGVRQLRMTRAGDTRLLLGQSGSVMLTVENTGARRLRAVVRDAWRPSAGAQPRQTHVSV